MKNYYCTQPNCDGLLIVSPMKLLMSPPIYQYQCLRCSHQYRRTANEDKFWPDENTPQGKNLFEVVKFKNLEWTIRDKPTNTNQGAANQK